MSALDLHPDCALAGCMVLAGDHCLAECRRLKDEADQDLPDLAWASYVYNRATCRPSQLAHLPRAAEFERRYREVFMRGTAPIDTESKPRWLDSWIPPFLRKGAA